VPEKVRQEMAFEFVDTIDQVLDVALEPAPPRVGEERLPRAARL